MFGLDVILRVRFLAVALPADRALETEDSVHFNSLNMLIQESNTLTKKISQKD